VPRNAEKNAGDRRRIRRPRAAPAALAPRRALAGAAYCGAHLCEHGGPVGRRKLTPEQEHKKRIDMMFAEKTLREVEAAGAERRPEGVSHVLESDERQTAAASAHSADRGEVGGPRGAEPTRFGDWERGGRASDF